MKFKFKRGDIVTSGGLTNLLITGCFAGNEHCEPYYRHLKEKDKDEYWYLPVNRDLIEERGVVVGHKTEAELNTLFMLYTEQGKKHYRK